jgi:hypothetical protein
LSGPNLEACFKDVESHGKRRQRQSKAIQFFRARAVPMHLFLVDWFPDYRFCAVRRPLVSLSRPPQYPFQQGRREFLPVPSEAFLVRLEVQNVLSNFVAL